MSPAERKIRDLAEKKAFDYVDTGDVARLAGCAPETARRVLKKLADECFEASDGTHLYYNDLVSEGFSSAGPKSGGKKRTQILWFFM